MTRKNELEFSKKTKMEIASWSGWKCMICPARVSRSGQPNIAHIIPNAETGPRSQFRNDYPNSFIKSLANGLLLCGICHNTIDNEEEDWPPELLFSINIKYRTEFESLSWLENSVDSLIRIDHLEKGMHALRDSLSMSQQDIEQEVKDFYLKEEFSDKIKLQDKLVLNDFDSYTKQYIKNFVKSNSVKYYRMLANPETEIYAIGIASIIKLLYKNMDSSWDEQRKYYFMKKTVTKAFADYNVHLDFVEYFFQVCEVFLK